MVGRLSAGRDADADRRQDRRLDEPDFAQPRRPGQFLERIAALPMNDDSKATAARLLADIEKWGPLVKAAKIEPQ